MNMIMVAFFACVEKTIDTSTVDFGSDTASDINEPSMSNGDCAYLNEEECSSESACTAIMASPLAYDETNTCWSREEDVFVECMSTDMSCGEAETYARPDPDASCMWFHNTCIPIEWDICDEMTFAECAQ